MYHTVTMQVMVVDLSDHVTVIEPAAGETVSWGQPVADADGRASFECEGWTGSEPAADAHRQFWAPRSLCCWSRTQPRQTPGCCRKLCEKAPRSD